MAKNAGITTLAPVSSVTIRAVVLNADGTVKSDLGVISSTDSRWHRKLLWAVHGKRAAKKRILQHNKKGPS